MPNGRLRSWPGWAGNLLLAGFGLLLSAALLEGGARVYVALEPETTVGEQNVYGRFDPLLGWTNRPGSSVRYRRREYQTEVQINALGFRDVDRTEAPSPDVLRIVALGDSFVEAFTVERDEGVTRRLESRLGASGCPVEVVNAGVHGYSTDQEALWFQERGAALRPRAVLLFFFYNDIINNVRDNYWGLRKPVVQVRAGRVEPVNTPLPGKDAGGAKEPVPATGGRRAPGSVFWRLIQSRMMMGAPATYSRLAQWGLWPPLETEGFADELRAFKSRGALPEFDEAWRRTAEILAALAQQVKAAGAEPVLVYIPARLEVSDRDWDLTKQRYGLVEAAWDRDLVNRRLRAAIEGSPWRLVDLTRALRAVNQWPREPYFAYDGHWNALGHDTAASAIAEQLRAWKSLACR